MCFNSISSSRCTCKISLISRFRKWFYFMLPFLWLELREGKRLVGDVGEGKRGEGKGEGQRGMIGREGNVCNIKLVDYKVQSL